MNIESGGPHARRRADRVALSAEVGLRHSGSHRFPVQVFDASPSGCKIEFIEPAELGERVWVKFEGIEAIEGTIRWVDGHYGGIEFVRPLYQGVFDRIAQSNRG